MARLVASLIVLVGLVAGCASERNQNLQRYETLHRDVRTAPSDAPQKWEMNPGAK